MNPVDRVLEEGLFHPLIDAGALYARLAGRVEAVRRVDRELRHQDVQAHAEQPDRFQSRVHVLQRLRKDGQGSARKVQLLRSSNVEGITRITGYFSKISGWNKGKLGELKDRHRVKLEAA